MECWGTLCEVVSLSFFIYLRYSLISFNKNLMGRKWKVGLPGREKKEDGLSRGDIRRDDVLGGLACIASDDWMELGSWVTLD